MKTTFAAGRSSSANNHDQGEPLAVLDLFNDKNSRSINQLVPLEIDTQLPRNPPPRFGDVAVT
jgi:hypothetical protein